jgi:outer membrane protein
MRIRTRCRCTLLAGILLAGPLSLMAQRALTLNDAIQTALHRNLDLQLLRNDAAAAEILDDYGVAGGLPSVTATANDQAQVTNIYQNLATGAIIERNGAVGNNLNATINGTLVLYNGMRIAATKDRLHQISQQSQELLAAQIQNTVAEVMTQYLDVRRQEAYLKTIDGSIAVAAENLKIVQARLDAGLANDADLFQARLDANALRQQHRSQELTITQAKADLLNLIQEDFRTEISLVDSLPVDENLNWDSLAAGLRQHPQLLAADHQIRIQQLLEREVTSQRMPTLRANAGLNYGNNISNGGFTLVSRNYGPYASLNLSVPIYNGNALRCLQEAAVLAIRNAEANRQNILQAHETELWKSWSAYRNALALLATERENAALSRRLLDLMLQKYSLRQATVLELKQAQKSYEEAGYRLTNLEFAAKVAEVELRRLGGSLP